LRGVFQNLGEDGSGFGAPAATHEQLAVAAAHLLAGGIGYQGGIFRLRFVIAAQALQTAGIDEMPLAGLELGMGRAQPVKRGQRAGVILGPDLGPRQTHQQGDVIGVDSHERGFIQIHRLGKFTSRDMFFGQQAPVLGRVGAFERGQARAQTALGIQHRGGLAIETIGGAAAQQVRQDLDREIGEHTRHRQEENDIDPEPLAPCAHDMGDAGDFDQQDQDVIGHGSANQFVVASPLYRKSSKPRHPTRCFRR
jgi:hypothetical protein